MHRESWWAARVLIVILLAGMATGGAAQTVVGATTVTLAAAPEPWDEAIVAHLPREQVEGVVWAYRSLLHDADLIVLPEVFIPSEAEVYVLPMMKEYEAIFAGADVLEIGTGSGSIALFAARLGARKVVATDISEAAVAAARLNAKRFGIEKIVDVRLVPPSDMRAYSVIRDDEAFDIIISNPPYALDLEIDVNTPYEDRGDLGISMVRGFDRHLKDGGVALLLYGSLFYHEVMVKFTRQQGYKVRTHGAPALVPWEAEALFNDYAGHLMEREQMTSGGMRFSWEGDKMLSRIHIVPPENPEPLLPGYSNKWYPGFMAVFKGEWKGGINGARGRAILE